jgi:flagellar protein FlgJ
MKINSLQELNLAKLNNLDLNKMDLNNLERISKQEENSFQDVLNRVKEEKDTEKLKKACRDIETLFIHQMLKQMKATVPQGGLLPESMATRIYRDMLDTEYSKLIAESPDNLGIAKMLYKELSKTS